MRIPEEGGGVPLAQQRGRLLALLQSRWADVSEQLLRRVHDKHPVILPWTDDEDHQSSRVARMRPASARRPPAGHRVPRRPAAGSGGADYGGPVLDLSSLDLDGIATALADQTDYEHRWLINPQTGELVFWTCDTGIDGQTPVNLDELDLISIDPLPSYIWYQDMADFADQVTDEKAGRRLTRAIQGKGAFRRFKAELHDEYPHLLTAWYA